jgi:antitoxin component YwqK of YwqJK toxin-antitoxin module
MASKMESESYMKMEYFIALKCSIWIFLKGHIGYPSGNIKTEGQYTNNITTGIWKSYYNNGQLKEEVQMAENEENGPFIEYHENGKVKAKGNYLHGPNEQDELLLYDTAGVLEKKMDCKEGICKTIWKRDSL